MNTYLCTPGPVFFFFFRLQALLCLIMVEWGRVARRGERETLCGCQCGSSALSLSCRQTDREHHYAVWQSCLSGVIVTPSAWGGILMSSPGTSISHLTCWGEQGHPNAHIPVTVQKLWVDTHIHSYMQEKQWTADSVLVLDNFLVSFAGSYFTLQ